MSPSSNNPQINGNNLINFVQRLGVNSIHKIYKHYSYNQGGRIQYDEISRKVNQLIGANPIYLNDNIINSFLVVCLRQQKNYVKSSLYRELTPESSDHLNERFVIAILYYLQDLQRGYDILLVKQDNPTTTTVANGHINGIPIKAKVSFDTLGNNSVETKEQVHIVLENAQDMVRNMHMNDPDHHKRNIEIMIKTYFDKNYPDIPYYSCNFRVYVDPAVREADDRDRAEFEEWKKNKNLI